MKYSVDQKKKKKKKKNYNLKNKKIKFFYKKKKKKKKKKQIIISRTQHFHLFIESRSKENIKRFHLSFVILKESL